MSIIILSGLLHELERPDVMLKAIEEIANKNTIIHINVPNANSFHRLLALESGFISNTTELSKNNIALQQHSVFKMETLIETVKNSISSDIDILDSGSYFVKPFTHKQMEKVLNEKIIDEKILDGFNNMIKYMPELGSEIYINFKIK